MRNKRVLVLFLGLVFMLAVVACGNKETDKKDSSFYAVISKSVTVASGYYYRARSYHYASSDSATSYTSALWIGN